MQSKRRKTAKESKAFYKYKNINLWLMTKVLGILILGMKYKDTIFLPVRNHNKSMWSD